MIHVAGIEPFFCPLEAAGYECERAAGVGGDPKRGLAVVVGSPEGTTPIHLEVQFRVWSS